MSTNQKLRDLLRSPDTRRLVSWERYDSEWGSEGDALVLAKDGTLFKETSGSSIPEEWTLREITLCAEEQSNAHRTTLEAADKTLKGARERVIRELAQLHRDLELCVVIENRLRQLHYERSLKAPETEQVHEDEE